MAAKGYASFLRLHHGVEYSPALDFRADISSGERSDALRCRFIYNHRLGTSVMLLTERARSEGETVYIGCEGPEAFLVDRPK